MMAKYVLDMNDMEDDFFENARLLGIVTSVKDYRFCLNLNQQLNFNLRRNDPASDMILRIRGREYRYPYYSYTFPNSYINFVLYQNYCDGEPLVSEVKNVDFLLLIRQGIFINEESYSSFLKRLRSIRSIQMVTEFAIEKLPNKTNLIF